MRQAEAQAELRKYTVSPQVAKNRCELLISLAQAFGNRQDEPFKTLMRVEHMASEALRAHPVAGNVFEVMEKALADEGYPTDGTVGRIMDVTRMTQDEVHHFTCFCHYGDKISGAQAKANLIELANR